MICSEKNTSDKLKLWGQNNSLFDHEEADISMMSHLLLNVRNNDVIQIESDDNDVFCLLVYFTWSHKLNNSKKKSF